MREQDRSLKPFFLGAHGENDERFERLLVAALRDHVRWRRDFHPEDLAPPGDAPAESPEDRASWRQLQDEMSKLTATLKESVPFPSPRYIGHMASDLLLPGLLAQLVTTLYNPNNVSTEAAPVTVELEREAIGHIARMIGYDAHSWGHLTGGGTVANFEGLWHARALRCFPLALARALSTEPALHAQAMADLDDLDDWALVNLPARCALDLLRRWQGLLDSLPTGDRARLRESVDAARIEHTGMARFFKQDDRIRPPVVMVPATAHYSWKKAMQVMGFGSAQLRAIPVDDHMRMDIHYLSSALQTCEARMEPVIAVVAVLGTTEYGTIDPLRGIVELRERHAFCIHADAAWGGYMASMFRQADGRLRTHEEVRREFSYFPSEAVYDAFAALGEADFVTVDPHKLGYLPFGVGAFLTRHGETRKLVAQHASYVFGDDDDKHPGRHAMEGSRPGAAAAATCVAHRVLPLHSEAFGRIPRQSVLATEYLFDRIHELAARVRAYARVCVPIEPDTNLICIAVNPVGNGDLDRMNAYMRELYSTLSVEPGMSPQSREFFGSSTTVAVGALAPKARQAMVQNLGLDPVSAASGKVMLLRHTLMNPWLFACDAAGNYLDRYCDYLERRIIELAGIPGSSRTARAAGRAPLST